MQDAMALLRSDLFTSPNMSLSWHPPTTLDPWVHWPTPEQTGNLPTALAIGEPSRHEISRGLRVEVSDRICPPAASRCPVPNANDEGPSHPRVYRAVSAGTMGARLPGACVLPDMPQSARDCGDSVRPRFSASLTSVNERMCGPRGCAYKGSRLPGPLVQDHVVVRLQQNHVPTSL